MTECILVASPGARVGQACMKVDMKGKEFNFEGMGRGRLGLIDVADELVGS